MCPGLPRSRLTLASQVSDLWNFKNTQGASHFSVYLQVRIADQDPQAGRSLQGPPLSSHCPHAPFPGQKGQGSPPQPHTDQLVPPSPQVCPGLCESWCRVCISKGRLSKRHRASPGCQDMHSPGSRRDKVREDDAQTPSGDQGQALRAKQSSVDALSGLGTKALGWGGRARPRA